MEIKKLIPLPVSPQLKEKMDRDKKHKEEASKSFGDYLISITNHCFDHCIDSESIYFSKKEDICIDNFFSKYTEAHQYTLNKFININHFSEVNTLDRSKDYGDYYGLLGYLLNEEYK